MFAEKSEDRKGRSVHVTAANNQIIPVNDIGNGKIPIMAFEETQEILAKDVKYAPAAVPNSLSVSIGEGIISNVCSIEQIHC